MRKLEAVADAVAAYHHYSEPESMAYDIRNPGMLAAESKHTHTPEGKRVFSCHRAGYAALLDVVQKRCSTHPNDNVEMLLRFLGIGMRLQQEHAIDFMSRCINSTAINLQTNLRFFIEEDHG